MATSRRCVNDVSPWTAALTSAASSPVISRLSIYVHNCTAGKRSLRYAWPTRFTASMLTTLRAHPSGKPVQLLCAGPMHCWAWNLRSSWIKACIQAIATWEAIPKSWRILKIGIRGIRLKALIKSRTAPVMLPRSSCDFSISQRMLNHTCEAWRPGRLPVHVSGANWLRCCDRALARIDPHIRYGTGNTVWLAGIGLSSMLLVLFPTRLQNLLWAAVARVALVRPCSGWTGCPWWRIPGCSGGPDGWLHLGLWLLAWTSFWVWLSRSLGLWVHTAWEWF